MNKTPYFWHKRTAALLSLLCLTSLLIAGFGHFQKTYLTSTDKQTAVAYSISCSIALAPHSGTSPADRDIANNQRLFQAGHNQDAYLERLGWAYVGKARESFDPGFYKLAQQTAACLAQRSPHSTQAQLLSGHVLHQLHEFQAAEKLARKLVEQRGSWMDYGLLGDTLMEQGRLSGAVQAYQQMLDLRPGPQSYFRAAHMRWLTGDVPGAIETIQLGINALGSRHSEISAWAYVRLASYAHQKNDSASADAAIGRALNLQPDYPPALLLRGIILLNRNANRKAMQVLAKASRLNPLPAYLWAYLEALQKMGDVSTSQALHQTLLEQGEALDRRTLSLYLATTRHNHETALALAKQELNRRQDVFTLDALAWAMRANNHLTDAYQYSVRALAEGTEDGRLYLHAAVIADESGKTQEAQRYYRKAMAYRHMLLPSEQQLLSAIFAGNPPHKLDLARLN